MDVLLVEPSRVGLKLIGRMLENRGDVVHPFTNGGTALDYLRHHPNIDVIITSFETQEVCGLELSWEARVLSERRNPLYIIVMSSSRERSKAIEAIDSGADDFIQKPPIREELYARLRAAERLIKTQKEIYRLARTDPLTGVFNRRSFFDQFKERIETENNEPFSLVLLDIDHFKRVNDNYGHDIGDLAICQVSGLLVHEDGIFGRIGGEEFAWALPAYCQTAAVEKAEEIRRAIEKMTIITDRGPLNITCSFGVAERGPGETVTELTKRADEALYSAKGSGRNCVAIAPVSLAMKKRA